MTTKNIFIVTGIGALIGFAAMQYVVSSNKDAKALLEANLAKQQEKLEEIANITFTNKRDEAIATYVKDCPTASRAEFDSYLDRLTVLSKAELERTELLFEACASFFADKKQASVLQLVEEYEEYKMLVDVASVFDVRAESKYEVEDWQLFIAFQKQLAELLKSQLPIQRDIITLLQDGVSANDPAIQKKTAEAQDIAQSATVITRQVDSVYSRLNK